MYNFAMESVLFSSDVLRLKQPQQQQQQPGVSHGGIGPIMGSCLLKWIALYPWHWPLFDTIVHTNAVPRSPHTLRANHENHMMNQIVCILLIIYYDTCLFWNIVCLLYVAVNTNSTCLHTHDFIFWIMHFGIVCFGQGNQGKRQTAQASLAPFPPG